jgi:hypothetical protein
MNLPSTQPALATFGSASSSSLSHDKVVSAIIQGNIDSILSSIGSLLDIPSSKHTMFKLSDHQELKVPVRFVSLVSSLSQAPILRQETVSNRKILFVDLPPLESAPDRMVNLLKFHPQSQAAAVARSLCYYVGNHPLSLKCVRECLEQALQQGVLPENKYFEDDEIDRICWLVQEGTEIPRTNNPVGNSDLQDTDIIELLKPALLGQRVQSSQYLPSNPQLSYEELRLRGFYHAVELISGSIGKSYIPIISISQMVSFVSSFAKENKFLRPLRDIVTSSAVQLAWHKFEQILTRMHDSSIL